MRNIYHILLALSFSFICIFAVTASAQTSENTTEPPAVPAQTIEQTVEQSQDVAPQALAIPDIDLSDPALIQALDAREKADRDIADAVKAQQEKTESTDSVEVSENGDIKKSIIPKTADDFKALGQSFLDKVLEWLKTPSFLVQLGALISAYILAPIVSQQVRKRVFLFQGPPAKDAKLKTLRDYIYESRVFLRAVFLVLLLALFAIAVKASFGQDWLVKLAQGLAVVFLVYRVMKTFVSNDIVQKLAIAILIPVAVLTVFGKFDELLGALDSLSFGSGDNPISALTLVKLGLFGTAFLWLGNFSNKKGQSALQEQDSLDDGIKAIVAKFLQILIFGGAAVMAMSAAGIGMGGLVVIFSAMSLGIGLGLQPVAANFVSGMILLFDRTVRVGDFISLDDGREGFVEAINMRSTTVETTDGKDIMVPNTTFIENSYENWTHKDPRQRYEVYFTVSYNTDIDKLEDLLIPAISEHPRVLQEPEEPDLELREFGEYGINFAIEFWCSGIDDGPNKFTSDLNFIVWRTLKANKIEVPLPQRVVHMKK